MKSAKLIILGSIYSFLFANSLQAKEIQSMKQILPYVNDRTLVVFDIDNTLAEAKQMLGTDQSFDWIKAKYLKSGLSDSKATEKALLYWQKIQHYSEMKPVEVSTPALVRYLQERKIPVVALTARGRNIAERTYRQLAKIGFSFARSSTTIADPTLGYYKGMMFATGRNKGDLLKLYLSKADQKIERVLFIDDKMHNVNDVKEAFQKTKWELVTFRYSRADRTVAGFNPNVAEIQSVYLNRILSDEHAGAILAHPHN